MHVAVIEAQTTAQCPLIEVIRSGGKHAYIKELIVGNEHFFTSILVALVHAIHPKCMFPSVVLGQHVAQIIVHGVQLHVEFGLVGIVFELLSAVLLVAQQAM